MKKLFCICLVLFLCFAICGCAQENTDPTVPPSNETETPDGAPSENPADEPDNAPSDEPNDTPAETVEVITLEEKTYIYGEVVGRIEPDILLLHPGTSKLTEQWGEIVCIVTDKASEWRIGDEVEASFTVAERPYDTTRNVRILADTVWEVLTVEKPIIYLYPEQATECSVRVTLKGTLTCTYPAHGAHGWQGFTAYPDGTLVFPDGKEYYALYWEGLQHADWDFSKGFCVRGEDTAAFLEWALAAQGLSAREANEFIVYWLPQMQDNPYNVISFQTEAYTDGAVLTIDPSPDSLLRVFMAYYAAEEAVEIPAQTFEPFAREGFTVVEWGGTCIKK